DFHVTGVQTCALPIYEVGALRDQVEAALDGGARVEPAAAVGEGVGRHVDDSHDRTAVPVWKSRDVRASAAIAHMFSVGPGPGAGSVRGGRGPGGGRAAGAASARGAAGRAVRQRDAPRRGVGP